MDSRKNIKTLLKIAERELTTAGYLPESVARLQTVENIRDFKAGWLAGFDRDYRGKSRALFGPAICRKYATQESIQRARQSIKTARRSLCAVPAWQDDSILSSSLEEMIKV